MRSIVLSSLLLATAGLAGAQQWEFGGVGGAGFLNSVGVTSSLAPATTGFQNGGMAGVFLGHSSNRFFGGEVRYAYLPGSLKISSAGSQSTFSGQSHVFHYDFILHTPSRGAKREFFLAAGGGLKLFRGTGAESAFQPLGQYGVFTRTQVIKPMLSIGGGMKYAITQHLVLRTEVRDYITAFPSDLIAPSPGVKFGRLLQDLVPMVGLSYVF